MYILYVWQHAPNFMKFKHFKKTWQNLHLWVDNFFVNLSVKGWFLWKETKFNLNTSFRIRKLLIWETGGWQSGQDLYSAIKVIKKKKPSQKATLATVQWFSGTKWISGTAGKFRQRFFFFQVLRESQWDSSNVSRNAVPFRYLNLVIWIKRTPENQATGPLLIQYSFPLWKLWGSHLQMLDSPLQIVQHTEHYFCPWHPSPISWSLHTGSTSRTHFHGGFYINIFQFSQKFN